MSASRFILSWPSAFSSAGARAEAKCVASYLAECFNVHSLYLRDEQCSKDNKHNWRVACLCATAKSRAGVSRRHPGSLVHSHSHRQSSHPCEHPEHPAIPRSHAYLAIVVQFGFVWSCVAAAAAAATPAGLLERPARSVSNRLTNGIDLGAPFDLAGLKRSFGTQLPALR